MAGLVFLGLANYAWVRRHHAGMGAFAVALFLFSAWPLVQAVDVLTSDLSLKIFLMKIGVDTTVFGALALVVMSADCTGNKRWKRREVIMALSVIPIIEMILNWFSPNALFRYGFFVDLRGPFPILQWTNGYLFPYFLFYAYVLFLIPFYLFFRRRRELSILTTSQFMTIFIALLFPLVGSMLFHFNITPIRGFNITPLLSLVTGSTLAAMIFFRGIFDAVPLPRERIISLMKDGVTVLDPSGRIIDMNLSAQGMMEVSELAVVGRPAKEVFAKWCNDLHDFFDQEEGRTEICIDNTPPRYFDLSLEPVCDKDGNITNRLLIMHDVTKRNMVETALLKSEERYRNLFSMMKEGFCIVEMIFDTDNKPVDVRFLETNNAFDVQTGLHDVQGKRMKEIAPNAEEYWFQKLGKIALQGEPVRFVYEVRELGRWFDAYAYSVGAPERRQIAIVFNDISVRKHSEATLVRKELELHEAERVAHLGSWYWDAKTRVLEGTDEFWDLYGIPANLEPKPTFLEMKGKYYPVSDWKKLRDAVVKTLKTGVGYELDLHAFRNGKPIWVATRIEVVKNETGEIIGLRGIDQDITERKGMEEALRESRERYRSLVKYAPTAIFEMEIGGAKFLNVNDATCNILKYSKEELLQKIKPIDLMSSEEQVVFKDRMKKKLNGELENEQSEYRVRRKDGEWINVSINMGEITKTKNGISIVVIGHDITDLRKAEVSLRNFISVLSHEMRNPLSPILTEIELLKMRNNDADPELKEALDVIGRQAEAMAGLLKDLLDVSRLERGKIELDKRKADLVPIIENAVETSKPMMSRAFQKVALSLPDEGITMSLVDPLRVGQIITNLLSNASKYSNENGVIEVSLVRQNKNAVIKITDHGRGISPESLDSIFGLFAQNEKGCRVKGGLGVGLFLSRELARLHGGTLSAKSEGLGKGSEFTLTLPIDHKD
jgi:PAS domain S-box-containing protein